MNKYQCFYNGKNTTIEAATPWAAKEKAVVFYKVPRSKTGLVAVVLCEVDGRTIEVSTSSL